ncbi:MAG: polysaccharide biosynthesis protein [Chloroflexi bacterium]|nr:polysaccharide biosynthesis protein [Chloroflexota bacterium]
MTNVFQDKNILVTGGTGSVGHGIVEKVLQYRPRAVRILSNDENGLNCLEKDLGGRPEIRLLLGDIRDKERIKNAVAGIDYVFHSAALKHVPICEYNPFEAVKTNVLGTQNLIEAAMEEEVTKFIAISTDKAVSPINVMGATKLLAERLTISANYYKGARKTAFACVRLGNVLDSRGSVVPLFREQIENGGPVMVTDPEMTRFVMGIPRAAELMLKAAEVANGGEIFILKMPALRIGDLAEVMIEELAPRYGHNPADIKIKIIGKRAGEKKHEELIEQEEAASVYELDDMFILTSQVLEGTKKAPVKRYSSKDETLLTREEIAVMLKEIPVIKDSQTKQRGN